MDGYTQGICVQESMMNALSSAELAILVRLVFKWPRKLKAKPAPISTSYYLFSPMCNGIFSRSTIRPSTFSVAQSSRQSHASTLPCHLCQHNLRASPRKQVCASSRVWRCGPVMRDCLLIGTDVKSSGRSERA
jgi:hypothetical protein